MRWGLIPGWWSKPLKEMRLATFNARSDTVASMPMFREAFKKRRCLIPASGFYEWQGVAEVASVEAREQLAGGWRRCDVD
jgi:putative SOS response-associated peptidase YedK